MGKVLLIESTCIALVRALLQGRFKAKIGKTLETGGKRSIPCYVPPIYIVIMEIDSL